jgi:hypothetical protein
MSQDSSDGLKSPELRPAMHSPEMASASSSGPQSQASSYSSPQKPAAYFSPPPNAAPTAPPAKPASWRLAVLGAAVTAGLAVGAWCVFGPTPAPPIPPVAAAPEARKVFSVSKVDADLKATEYLKNLLAGKTEDKSAATNAADPLRAVNAPALRELAKTSPKLAADIQSGRSSLYRVYILDFLEEDGDHAELSVDGVSFGDLYLTNAGKEFLIPLTRGVPARMKLLATADGGGGVTVGFVSSLGEARTRVLQVGEAEEWQVTVK